MTSRAPGIDFGISVLRRRRFIWTRRFFVRSQPILCSSPLLSMDSLLDCVGAHFRLLKIRTSFELFNITLRGQTVSSSAVLSLGGDYARTRNIAPWQSGAMAPVGAGGQRSFARNL